MNTQDLPFEIYRIDGEKIIDQYAEALDWLQDLGLAAKASRFGKYKKVIANFDDNLDASKDEESTEKIFHEYLNAHMEVTDVIRIHNSLSNRDFFEFSEQLKKVTSGQPFRNSSNNDPSRDFTFELTMASRFINGGFEVQLNQMADIVAVKDGYPKLFLECKRIKSKNRIQANVKKANEQLKNRISSDSSKLCKGIVALNVTDIVNPENNMTIVNNVDDLQKISSTLLKSFVKGNSRDLETKRFNKCLGVIVETSMQGYLINLHRTMNCRGAALYQYQNSGSDELLTRNISLLIANQNACDDYL